MSEDLLANSAEQQERETDKIDIIKSDKYTKAIQVNKNNESKPSPDFTKCKKCPNNYNFEVGM